MKYSQMINLEKEPKKFMLMMKKPTLIMEEGKDSYDLPEKFQGPEVVRVVEQKGRGLQVSVILSVVTVTIAVALLVSFGTKLIKDSQTDTWQIYRLPDGQTVEQRLTVTQDVIDVKVPDKMQVIYDLIHDIVVTRFEDSNTGLFHGNCYAREINDSESYDIRLRDHKYQTEVNLSAPLSTVSESWEVTNNNVPDYMIGQRVKNMCATASIFWMKRTNTVTNGRSKRNIFDTASCHTLVLYARSLPCKPHGLTVLCAKLYMCFDEEGQFIRWAMESSDHRPRLESQTKS